MNSPVYMARIQREKEQAATQRKQDLLESFIAVMLAILIGIIAA